MRFIFDIDICKEQARQYNIRRVNFDSTVYSSIWEAHFLQYRKCRSHNLDKWGSQVGGTFFYNIASGRHNFDNIASGCHIFDNASAVGTFLTISQVGGTFLTISHVGGTFLTISHVGGTFWTILQVGGTFLTISQVGVTFLTGFKMWMCNAMFCIQIDRATVCWVLYQIQQCNFSFCIILTV